MPGRSTTRANDGKTSIGASVGLNWSCDTRMIKLAFMIWTLIGMGGSEKVVHTIARKLDRKRFSSTIISFEDGPVRKMYEELGLSVHVVPKRGGHDPACVFKLRQVLRQEQIDIVNPHHFGPLVYAYAATRMNGVKLVYTEHSRWQLEQLSGLKKTANMVMLAQAQALVAITEQIENYYVHSMGLHPDKVHLIRNGIDGDIYHERGRGNLRNELGLADDSQLIGMVANLRPEKNHKIMIAAFNLVAEAMPGARLVLIGLDCMQGEVQRYAAGSRFAERIHFLGLREDVPELLSSLDVVCLPSRYEGLPLTILEAMACSVPVIGADVLGINGVIRNDVNGLLVPADDHEHLARCVMRLLNDEPARKRLTAAGKTLVAEHFSLDAKIKEYEYLFSSLARKAT
jgi:glycosyltransferase involved in cell wall biosynthesis